MPDAESDWRPHAEHLASEVTHPTSRWRAAVAATPRHVFVPRWWDDEGDGAALTIGSDTPDRWLRIAHANRSLVTRIGARHADHAQRGETARGMPTSSSTMPWLVVRMYQHAVITNDSRVLVVTGSGYGTALACQRLGDEQVTSIDIDPYLVKAGAERLGSIGVYPRMEVCDLTGPLPGRYDRIISTVSVRSIPASWLAALNPGGRLVTTIADTGLVLTADKTDGGGAAGQIEREGAGFMTVRHGEDYPPRNETLFADIRDRDGESITTSPYPVVRIHDGWELWSTFTLEVPGVEHRYIHDENGRKTAWMVHPDGSWARATGIGTEPAEVHQGGPRRLWEALDRIRGRWLADGCLNTYGAKATITPDGVTTLARGGWTATL